MPPTLDDEVTYISGLNPDGTLALNSSASWNGDNPATYDGGSTLAAKWYGTASANTARTSGGTVNYYFDPSSNWTTAEQNAFIAGLALWSAIANVNFALTTNAANAQITFTRGSDGGAHTDTQYSIPSGAGVTGGTKLVQLTKATVSIDTSVDGFGPIGGSLGAFGGYPWQTVLHEIGHALGLEHGGPYPGGASPQDAQYSPYDTRQYTIMSYNDPWDTHATYYNQYATPGTNWGHTGLQNGYIYYNEAVTWMPVDILAIQRLYGTPINTPLSGGQTFGFNTNLTGPIAQFFDFTKNTTPVVTLWDAGTNNTLDISGFSVDATVNLNVGTFSNVNGHVNNLAIAYNTRIDTLVSGSGNDVITANNDGDTIDGGAGNDTITGGTGSDRIYGGPGTNTIDGKSGIDTAAFGNVRSAYTVVGNTDGTVTVSGSGETDTLKNIEYLAFSDQTIASPSGSAGNPVLGTSGNDTLFATAANDYIDGGAGFDIASYINAAAAVMVDLSNSGQQNTIGSGLDTIVDVEGLTGSNYNDVLKGNAGNNILQGGLGDDYLDGGAGFDLASYADAASGVTVSLSAPGAQNTGGAGTDTLLNFEGLIGSAFNDSLTGAGGNDTLRGNGGTNVLDGGGGTDTAAFALAPGSYYVTANADGSYTVQGPGETDTLKNIEQASFDATGQTLTLAQFQAQSFDPLAYIASYGDLIAGLGANAQAGLDHWVQHGYYEGRSVSFNSLAYIASNPDLIVGLGANANAGATHYIQHGYAEGRSTATFNALNYIASNPDLIVGLGADATAGATHYIQHGYYEGRTTSFDPLNYIASNADLIVGLGANATAGATHYIQHGYSEGRTTNSFDPLAYIASNPDLIVGLGANATAGATHYIQHGFFEGRTTSFNPLNYIASNPDLIVGLGADATAGATHYIQHGYSEGRVTNSFDPLVYIASNPDLIVGFGANATAGATHYIQHGYYEGRVTNSFDPVAYLLSNSDLAGMTTTAATTHYIQHGYGEGRSAAGAFGMEQASHLLAPGTADTDTIGSLGDLDWFSVNLTGGQSYDFSLSGADSSNGTLADPLLSLYGATGTLLAQDNDSEPGRDSLIHFTATATGTFYLVAQANGSATGTYKILAATA